MSSHRTMASPVRGAASAEILNGVTRLDASGAPINAHQGSMLLAPDGRFYLFGNYHRACVAATQCHCRDHQAGWTVTNGIGVYSSPDLTSWRFERGPILPPYNQPRVAYFPSTGRYHLYAQFPLILATSSSPAGPFTLQPGNVELEHSSSDMNVFVDPADGRGYIIYTSRDTGNRITVQRLTADGRRGERGASSARFGPSPCEAPTLFKRGATYWAIFGKNCWCCADGAQAYAFSAPHPLGPWTGGRDLNAGAGGRVVRGQSAFALAVPSASAGASPTILLAFDQWMTGATRASMYQYWGQLEFDDRGAPQTLRWQDRWTLPLPPNPNRRGAPPPVTPPSPPPPQPSTAAHITARRSTAIASTAIASTTVAATTIAATTVHAATTAAATTLSVAATSATRSTALSTALITASRSTTTAASTTVAAATVTRSCGPGAFAVKPVPVVEPAASDAAAAAAAAADPHPQRRHWLVEQQRVEVHRGGARRNSGARGRRRRLCGSLPPRSLFALLAAVQRNGRVRGAAPHHFQHRRN